MMTYYSGINLVLNLSADFDAKSQSARWSSGRYSSWNIANYFAKYCYI